MRELILHVGTPKSGTTHLQAILWAARTALAAIGVLYPGARYLPRQGFNQQPAIYALAGPTIGWADETVRNGAKAYFEQLCAELADHRGRALVSAESLSFFETSTARQLLDRLGYDPSRVTVVITSRDLGRVLPSIWQQNVKNGSTQALEPYLDSVASLRDQPGAAIWTAFGLPGLVQRWSEVVGVERVVLVTSPPRRTSSDALWQRFAAAARIPASLVDAPTTDRASLRRADDNLSLSRSQAELIRQLNVVLQVDGYPRDVQQRLRARLLQIWMNLAPGTSPVGERPAVPGHLHDAVRRWSQQDVAALERCGVRVVGSLDDLEPVLPPAHVHGRPTTVDPETARNILALLGHAGRPAPGLPRLARWGVRLSALLHRSPRSTDSGTAAADQALETVDLSERRIDLPDPAQDVARNAKH